MTLVLLVRHAAHDNVGGFLAGRSPGIRLGNDGRGQARRLAERMRQETLGAIHCSPRARALETAEAIANITGGPEPIVDDALDEVDFGAWSGRTFDDLNQDVAFRRWNAARSIARTAARESMLDVQARAWRYVEAAAAAPSAGAIVIVSHAEVIKAVVMLHLGLGFEAWPRLEISPASITKLELDGWSSRILGLNEVIW